MISRYESVVDLFAPDRPYGSQAGPGGMFARWCLRDDCDWRHSGKERPA